jgi:hypothetical protein
MTSEETASIEVAPTELGLSLASVRLCAPEAQQEMKQSLAQLGQLTPLQAYRVGPCLELFDGLKRARAACQLSWPSVRVEVCALDAAGAKVRLLRCNAAGGLTVLEEAWLVRALYREDKVLQPQIALLLSRHKSWVCRRLALAEGLSDELSGSVRLGLISATAVRELGRLPRGNQDEVARVVARRGLTTRQLGRLVDELLAATADAWPQLLERASQPAPSMPKGCAQRRSPAEQLVADAWTMKRLCVRMHARLLERSLQSLGMEACATVSHEFAELHAALSAMTHTLELRLAAQGEAHASA